MDQIGKVTRFFPKISVAVVELNKDLQTGEKIVVKAHGGSFEQVVDSMQINKEPIKIAKANQEVALKVNSPVKEGDLIFRAD